MRKLSIFTLALCLLLTGCQLAKPEAEAHGDPVGVWMEMHKEGDSLQEGYVPTVDFESTEGLGLILIEEEISEEGNKSSVFGTHVSGPLMDRAFGTHTDMKDDKVTTITSSFGATLYVDGNDGAAPEEVWIWYVYEDSKGNYYAGDKPQDIFYLRHYSISQNGGAATYKTSYRTEGDIGQATEASYSFRFEAVGRLERVRILEFNDDFVRTSSVEWEVKDGDEYQVRPGTEYVVIQETSMTNGQEKTYDTVYSVANAIDYDGQLAQYHTCKYMGQNGLVIPRALKILF